MSPLLSPADRLLRTWGREVKRLEKQVADERAQTDEKLNKLERELAGTREVVRRLRADRT